MNTRSPLPRVLISPYFPHLKMAPCPCQELSQKQGQSGGPDTQGMQHQGPGWLLLEACATCPLQAVGVAGNEGGGPRHSPVRVPTVGP